MSDDTQSGFNQKFIKICSDIQNGISKCKETCAYFAFCGGGAPSNKLHENGTFDSTETMHCKLRIKALIDVCLEHLESKYGLNEYQELSITKRMAKIGEQMGLSRMNSSLLLKLDSEHLNQSNMFEQIYYDDWNDWHDR